MGDSERQLRQPPDDQKYLYLGRPKELHPAGIESPVFGRYDLALCRCVEDLHGQGKGQPETVVGIASNVTVASISDLVNKDRMSYFTFL